MAEVQNHTGNQTDYGHCPILATHRRLAEAHLLWHQALSNYQVPDSFRANLNATIQALRNVTFALQSEKQAIDNFSEWYGEWQTRLAAEPDAKWLIDARNLVVKQGDLELTSTALVRVLTWKDDVLIELQVPPAATTSLILNSIPLLDLLEGSSIPAGDLRASALEIERRWSVAALQGRELLETLARVYGLLSEVVLDAHAQVNRLECIPIDPAHPDFRSAYHRTDILECMAVGREQRTRRSKLASRHSYDLVSESSPVSANDLKRARRRYGLGKNQRPEPWQSSDPILKAENIVDRAKQILKKDKSHARMMFIRDGHGAWRQTIVNAADRTEKHVLMRVVASFIERIGADALIDVSETWMLPANAFQELERHEIQDAPSRKEALQVLIATREGIRRAYTTPFARGVFGRIKLENTHQSDDERGLHYLTPVFEVWRRQGTQTLSDGTIVRRVWEPDPLDTCFCGGPRRFIECCRPMMEDVRASDSIGHDVQTALENGDSSRAEQLARASLARYVIWIKQHTAPTQHVAEELHQNLINVDVPALHSYVRLLRETLAANGHADEFIPALIHLSEIVGVPQIAIRLATLTAQSLWESGDVAGAVAQVKALGRLDQIDDAMALILATRIVDLPSHEVLELLSRAARMAFSDGERVSAKLELAKHLIESGDKESALREVDSAIVDSRSDPANPATLADALCFRWEVSNDDVDFRAARTALEALEAEQVWQRLASLLIDHGDYQDANAVLANALAAGDITACLLAVDARLRMGETDSARELLLALPGDCITSDLLYPYAYTMGLVALICDDQVLRRAAASNLRKVVAFDTPMTKPAETLLAALED